MVGWIALVVALIALGWHVGDAVRRWIVCRNLDRRFGPWAEHEQPIMDWLGRAPRPTDAPGAES